MNILWSDILRTDDNVGANLFAHDIAWAHVMEPGMVRAAQYRFTRQKLSASVSMDRTERYTRPDHEPPLGCASVNRCSSAYGHAYDDYGRGTSAWLMVNEPAKASRMTSAIDRCTEQVSGADSIKDT